jgi:hypothetical protein
MTITTELPTRYSHPNPVAPEGRFPDSSMVVGAAAVTPRSPPTVEAEGHEVAPVPAATAALLEEAAELDPAAAAAKVPGQSDDRVSRQS